jgi:hypothetical protein
MKNSSIRSNSRTIVDLNKVAYCLFYYRAKEYERVLLPNKPTVRGQEIDSNEYALQHHDYPAETLLERARRLDILDKWIPVLSLMLSNGHKLEYTGDRAKSLYKTYKAKIYATK